MRTDVYFTSLPGEERLGDLIQLLAGIHSEMKCPQACAAAHDWYRLSIGAIAELFWQCRSGSAPCRVGDYVKTKRALIRAVEKQAEMEERMDLLKACL
jgi:hypothetical protein